MLYVLTGLVLELFILAHVKSLGGGGGRRGQSSGAVRVPSRELISTLVNGHTNQFSFPVEAEKVFYTSISLSAQLTSTIICAFSLRTTDVVWVVARGEGVRNERIKE